MSSDTTLSFDVDAIVAALAKTLANAINIFSMEVSVRTGGNVHASESVVIRATIGLGSGRRHEISGMGENIGLAAAALHNSAEAWMRLMGCPRS